jgi:predicted permease
MDVGQLGYTEAQGRAFFEDVERRVRATAGVQDASFAFTVPMGYVSTGHVVEGEGAAPGGRPFAGKNAVGAGYFSTMGIPIVRGRRFDERDHGPARPIAVVNERLAAELWPGLDAVGRRLREAGSTGRWLEVVGVTRTGKYRLLFEDPQPHYYVPLAQHETALRVLHVRTSMAPDALAPAIERVIREREPQIVLFDVQGMDRALGGGYGLFLVRVAAVFAGIFGVLALALAVVGLFGVASYAASQRTREIGVRIALGASPRAVVRLLVRDGLSVVGVGLLAGLSLALLVSGVLRGFLFGLSARDPLTFAGVVPLLGLAALTAYAVPAVRAARVDPAVTLRRE